MDRQEQLNEIKKLEDSYGLQLFSMGLTHLLDSGHRNINEESTQKSIDYIMAATPSKNPIMTPEFQCEIVRCAAELAEFDIFTLLVYIKRYMEIK